MHVQSLKPYQSVIDYYQNLESKLGYDFILGGTKHFGFYPNKIGTISEEKAQILTQDELARRLHLGSQDIVLDAGCGQGNVAVYLAKKFGCHITGVTVVPFEVGRARNLARQKGLSDRVSFQEMDYAQTTFPDKTFDAVYSMEGFVHAYDMTKALNEFKRLLKPGGRIVFFEYSIANEKELKAYDKTLSKGSFLNNPYDYLGSRPFVAHLQTSERTGYSGMRPKEFLKKYGNPCHWLVKNWSVPNLANLRHGVLPKRLQSLGFTNVNEENILENIAPSFLYLYKRARTPFKLVELFHLEKFFVNTTSAAVIMPHLLEADIFRYNVTTAKKAAN